MLPLKEIASVLNATKVVNDTGTHFCASLIADDGSYEIVQMKTCVKIRKFNKSGAEVDLAKIDIKRAIELANSNRALYSQEYLENIFKAALAERIIEIQVVNPTSWNATVNTTDLFVYNNSIFNLIRTDNFGKTHKDPTKNDCVSVMKYHSKTKEAWGLVGILDNDTLQVLLNTQLEPFGNKVRDVINSMGVSDRLSFLKKVERIHSNEDRTPVAVTVRIAGDSINGIPYKVYTIKADARRIEVVEVKRTLVGLTDLSLFVPPIVEHN